MPNDTASVEPVDIDARTDATHREVLSMLPPDLFDFSDLEVGIDRLMALLGATPVELPDHVAITDHTVTADDGHEMVVRVYRAEGTPEVAPALYWIHGGGMVLGEVAGDDPQCTALADELKIVVVSVDYRLAPAFAHPTPVHDCRAGYRWLLGQVDALGVDPARIALGGASAGAGLAAGLALLLRDHGETLPCFQLLRYPMLDDRNTTPSSHEITDGRVWNRATNLVCWRAYLGDAAGGDDVDVYAAPARATDLTGLPPAIVTVGGLDLFRDEDIAYAQALLQAGVATELHVYPPSFHASDIMVAHSEASQRWRSDELAALRRALGLSAG